MDCSSSIKNLCDALSKAQTEMPVVQKDSVNPFLKNKYASLGAIIEATRPVLGKHGLAVMQFPIGMSPNIGVTTMVTHVSGEWIRESAYFSVGEEKGKSAAQVAGSIITYLRRYSYSGVLGVVSDEDTDGSAPEKPAITPKLARVWSVALKQAIVDAGFASNDFDAKGMLDLSKFPEDVPLKNALFWAKAYRCARDEDLPPYEASVRATDEYEAEKVRRQQDKAQV
jgi:hypothetical protein